jgi:multiple sugar transport system substrate-binding protein
MAGKSLSRRSMLKLAGLSLAGAAVAACGGTPTSTPVPAKPTTAPAAAATKAPVAAATPATSFKDVTLKQMVWGGLPAVRQSARDVGLRTVYPDLPKIEFLSGGGGDQDVANTLRLALAAGDKNNIPDLVQFNKIEVPEFAVAGELLDLTETFQPYLSDLYAGVQVVSAYNSKYWSFPYQLKSKLVYYRGDMWDEAGVKPSDIKTTADFLTVGKTFHTKFPNSYIWNGTVAPNSYNDWFIMSAYDNARFADPGGNWVVQSGKWFTDCFNFYKAAIDAKILHPTDDFSTDWQKAFTDNSLAGTFNAQWMAGFLPGYVPEQKGKWRYDLWPKMDPLPDMRYGSDGAGSCYVVFKKCPNPQAAISYMSKFMLDKAGAMGVFRGQGMIPLLKSAKDEMLAFAKTGQKPAGLSDADWAKHPINYFGPDYAGFEAASYDYLKSFGYDPQSAKEITIFTPWQRKYNEGSVSLADCLKGIEADCKSQIGDPFKV